MRRMELEKRREERGLGVLAKRVLDDAVHPVKPVEEPSVDPELPELPFLIRVSEAFVYILMELEHAVSRSGYARSWVRLCCLLAVLVAVPTLTVLPILMGFMAGVTAICYSIYQAVLYLFLAFLLVLAGVVVVSVAMALGKRERW